MVIRFNQCFHGCLHYRIQKIISEHFFLVTPPTSVQNSAIFAPFTKGKSHRPLFAFPPKNVTFKLPKGSSMKHPPDAARKNQLFAETHEMDISFSSLPDG